MNRLVSLLALLLMLTACRTVPPAETSGTADNPMLAVVTLNLYHDKDDWPQRRKQIVEALEALQPDVIALQEVLQHETLPNQAQWLAEALGYQWYFISVDPEDKARRYGNALLTRHPVLARGQQRLQPMEDSRSAGFVRIKLQGQPVNVYVTHLHHTPEGKALRTQQVDDLMAFLHSTREGMPSVVTGDFNTAADSPELDRLRSDFTDSFSTLHPGATPEAASTLNPAYFPTPASIDHVFHQRGRFLPLTAALLFNQPDAQGVWASDHRGVSVTLRLQPSGQGN